MNLSVYTSAFNLESGIFDIKDALENWFKYANQVVVGTFADQTEKVLNYFNSAQSFKDRYRGFKIKIVSCDTSLNDPLFDGKLKNAALRECYNDIVIQQDLDERLSGYPAVWNLAAKQLQQSNLSAFMIPVVDLYKDEYHFKSIGTKWYMHKKAGCYRGPVNFAKRPDGTIDTDKSDSCELIDKGGNLVTSGQIHFDPQSYPTTPIVLHYGYLDLQKRQKQNEIWEPVWSARKGEPVFVEKDIDKLGEFEYHELPFRILK